MLLLLLRKIMLIAISENKKYAFLPWISEWNSENRAYSQRGSLWVILRKHFPYLWLISAQNCLGGLEPSLSLFVVSSQALSMYLSGLFWGISSSALTSKRFLFFLVHLQTEKRLDFLTFSFLSFCYSFFTFFTFFKMALLKHGCKSSGRQHK